MKMNAMDYIVWILVVIGGINWGLVGAFEYNLVDSIFGENSGMARTIYVLVGLAAVYALLSFLMRMGQSNPSARR